MPEIRNGLRYIGRHARPVLPYHDDGDRREIVDSKIFLDMVAGRHDEASMGEEMHRTRMFMSTDRDPPDNVYVRCSAAGHGIGVRSISRDDGMSWMADSSGEQGTVGWEGSGRSRQARGQAAGRAGETGRNHRSSWCRPATVLNRAAVFLP
jgi:hypothetical protein